MNTIQANYQLIWCKHWTPLWAITHSPNPCGQYLFIMSCHLASVNPTKSMFSLQIHPIALVRSEELERQAQVRQPVQSVTGQFGLVGSHQWNGHHTGQTQWPTARSTTAQLWTSGGCKSDEWVAYCDTNECTLADIARRQSGGGLLLVDHLRRPWLLAAVPVPIVDAMHFHAGAATLLTALPLRPSDTAWPVQERWSNTVRSSVYR